jgi:hypothetical protein
MAAAWVAAGSDVGENLLKKYAACIIVDGRLETQMTGSH